MGWQRVKPSSATLQLSPRVSPLGPRPTVGLPSCPALASSQGQQTDAVAAAVDTFDCVTTKLPPSDRDQRDEAARLHKVLPASCDDVSAGAHQLNGPRPQVHVVGVEPREDLAASERESFTIASGWPPSGSDNHLIR